MTMTSSDRAQKSAEVLSQYPWLTERVTGRTLFTYRQQAMMFEMRSLSMIADAVLVNSCEYCEATPQIGYVFPLLPNQVESIAMGCDCRSDVYFMGLAPTPDQLSLRKLSDAQIQEVQDRLAIRYTKKVLDPEIAQHFALRRKTRENDRVLDEMARANVVRLKKVKRKLYIAGLQMCACLVFTLYQVYEMIKLILRLE